MSQARKTMRTTAQLVRAYRGPPLWSFGFRPFFLLAGLFAALAIPGWAAALVGGAPPTITRDWHVHEMLWGYAGAVIAGYMMIAGANWTGRYPVVGRPVMVLAGLWLAGRVAMAAPGLDETLRAAIDCAFLLIFAAALWREHAAAKAVRAVAPAAVVTLLALSNIGFHLGSEWPDLARAAERVALGAIVLLIAIMGGRLVPSFTRNWAAQAGREAGHFEQDALDRGAVVLVALALGGWVLVPQHIVTAALLAAAGGASAVRLLRWWSWALLREPLLWVLHAGYAWLALGLLLLGASIGLPEAVPLTSGVHALTAGTIGVMTLGLMVRTTLSHTGRERRVGRATSACFILVNLAAAVRVAAPLLPTLYLETLLFSAGLWSLGFALFVLIYGPMLLGPRRGATNRQD